MHASNKCASRAENIYRKSNIIKEGVQALYLKLENKSMHKTKPSRYLRSKN